ncbi:DUF4150 domain-containing protein [Neisseria zoodegmatis]|uniref:DUF4150 domain-containing protein n=1 Tax=Neisseria zoodegmatis TaxID=326523 RepID=UPI000A18D44C|nr:DUF4150 domain-containing protein [Neisseria zoodegmatis]
MIFTVPDFCWLPPPTVPPIPFPPFADLCGAKTVAKDIKINHKFAFIFKASKINKATVNNIALISKK